MISVFTAIREVKKITDMNTNIGDKKSREVGNKIQVIVEDDGLQRRLFLDEIINLLREVKISPRIPSMSTSEKMNVPRNCLMMYQSSMPGASFFRPLLIFCELSLPSMVRMYLQEFVPLPP